MRQKLPSLAILFFCSCGYKSLSQHKLRQIVSILIFLTPFFSFAQSTTAEALYFSPNNYKIDEKYFPVLNTIGNKCASDTFSFLKIVGYSDKIGSIKHNERLSQKRAEEVYNYLAKFFKIDTSKIYVTWLGEEIKNAYELHFPDAHVQQRCVDIIVTFKKPVN